MARVRIAVIVGLLGGLAFAWAPRSGTAQEVPPPDSTTLGAFYHGPVVLSDPADPFQGLRWTLGVTIPPRNRLMKGRRDLAPVIDYDPDRKVVLLSYQAERREILPPMALTPEEFVGRSFHRELRTAWIEGNQRVLTEAQGRGDEGLVNLSLPFELPFTEKIFGQGAPNLRVSGREQITFSGTSSWVVDQVSSERGGGSIFPKLDMRQQLNVNLQGTIGSKLYIDVAQNSEALTPLENSIKIRYKGEEDEIVKSVELGNTNLSLPTTQFISFSTRQEGLFGVKAEAQVGGVGVTAIASRQEGESGQATLSGGAKEQEQTIEDFRFLSGRYFFISDPDSVAIPQLVPGALRVYLDDRYFQNDVELGAQEAQVWLDPAAKTPQNAPYKGQFHLLKEEDDYTFVNDENYAQPILILRNSLSTNQVLAVSYRLLRAPGDTVDVGSYRTPAAGDTLQLKMIRPGDDQWGTNLTNESIWAAARRLELRNVYSLNAMNLDPESFTLKVERDLGANNPTDFVLPDGSRVPYLQVLGLDQRNNSDASDYTPDGRVDPEFIDYTNGLLFFPDLRPFDPSRADILGTQFRARSWPIFENLQRPAILGWHYEGSTLVRDDPNALADEVAPEIYDYRPTYLGKESSNIHLFNIVANFRTAVNTIQLSALGTILEGSVTVRLDNEVLKPGEDYTVFYDTGTINLKNAAATAPGANLMVTYSYDSPFSRGSRSLVGASVGSLPDPNAKLSFSTSWLNESRGVPDRRPRLGQEPTKTTVGDISGQLRLQPWKLTQWVDALPLVSTTAPSKLEVQGALGLSFPNPNTRGEVYIDDMEGAELITSPGMARYNWFFSSAPARASTPVPGGGTQDVTPYPTDRGRLLWFSPNTVRVGDVTPGAEVRDERDDLVPTLEVVYIPQENPAGPGGSWGGLVTTLSPTGVDISQSQYIDIWVNDYLNFQGGFGDDGLPKARRGELYVDIGNVSEDAVWDPITPPAAPNDSLDFEDRNYSGGTVEYDEDIGLDAKPNSQEVQKPGERFTPISAASDPAGDDRVEEIKTGLPEHSLSQRIAKYLGINGTERNQQADTEDLNGDMRLQTNNDYLEYRIDLADSAFTDLGRDYPGQFTDPKNGWRLYRIPLNEYYDQIGNPDLSTVRNMRIWFRGIETGDTLNVQFSGIDIVGNRWEVTEKTQLCEGQLFNVAVVNSKDNGEYNPPFEVERVNNIAEREQSISLEFEDFRNNGELGAFRPLLEAKDYTLYKEIAYYVSPHLENLAPEDSVEFFVRFGSNASTDTLEYYEVSTVLTRDDPRLQVRGDGWLDFRFALTDLSRLKIGAPNAVRQDSFLVGGPFYASDCSDIPVEEETGEPGNDGEGERDHFERFRTLSTTSGFAPQYPPRADIGNGLQVTIRGTPSFSRVRRISVGLRNVSGRSLPRGRVWFNELRMGDVRREKGVAARGSVSLVLADLASIQASLSSTSAEFLRLGQTRGSGTTDVNYVVASQVSLHKFVEGLGLQAPLSVRLSKSRRTPKFRSGSDIEFDGADSGRDITETGSRDLSLSLARDGRTGSTALTRYTIDAVRLSGSVARAYNLGSTQVDTTLRVNGTAGYNLNLGTIQPVRLLNRLDFYPWPQSVQATLSGGHTERRVWSRDESDPTLLTPSNGSDVRSGNLVLSSSIKPIRALTYSWSSSRDLVDSHFGPDTSIVRLQRPPTRFFGLNLGRETRQNQNLSLNYSPPFGLGLRPRVSWSGSYSRNSDPNLTRADYDSTVIDVNNNNSANLSFSVPLGRSIQRLLGGGGGNQAARTATPNRERAFPNRSQRAESDSTKQGEDEKAKGPSTKDRLRTLFSRYINVGDVQASATFAKRNSVSGIHGTPPLSYQLGLSRDVGLGESVHQVYRAPFNQSNGETETYRGSSSVKMLGQIGVDFSYQKRTDHTRTNNSAGRVEDDTTWPEMRFNWGNFYEKLPLLNSIFTDFRAVSTTYSKSTKTSGTQSNPAETVTRNTNWRPLFNVSGTVKGNWRTSISVEKSSSETVSQREGSAASTSTRSSVTYRLTLGKRFTRSGGGTVGKDIDFNLDATYNKQSSVTKSSAAVLPPQVRENDNAQMRASATVKFTRTVSGTFGLNLGQKRDITSNRTTRSIGISFTTGFNF